jgi:uncharacterized membrane protein
MADQSHEQSGSPFPEIRHIGVDAPPGWLGRGWADLRAAPAASLFYGVVLALMGLVIGRLASQAAYELAFVTGFLLVGPFLAMGLYDISRRRERGASVSLRPTLLAWKANLPAIALYSLILALLMAVWIRVSVVVVALFFEGGMPSMDTLARDILQSENGLFFVAAYLAAGGGFALLVFATSVVSLPMLLDREKMDTLTAMITSFNAVRLNFWPMVLWGLLIVGLTAVGFATFYVGLIVLLPVIGHATWHAYRDVVASPQDGVN